MLFNKRNFIIELFNCTKTYINGKEFEITALSAVTLKLPDNGLVGILGKSGSGKSTLLNIIGGLDIPSEGYVCYEGLSLQNFSATDFDKLRNNYIGYIFQEFNLLNDLDVYNNIKLALSLQNESKENIENKITDILEKLDITENIIGDNNIAITDYLADSFVHYGLTAYQEQSSPQSREQLIGSGLIFNNKTLQISGIIDTDYEKYLDLVDEDFSFFENEELVYRYRENYSVILANQTTFEKVFVNSHFINDDVSLYVELGDYDNIYRLSNTARTIDLFTVRM